MKCKDHPDAPHGFNRDASHLAGKYVCECESWEPEQIDMSKQNPICKSDLQIEIGKQEWVGLTDEDMYQLRREGAHSVSDKDFRAIEAKLKEKNT